MTVSGDADSLQPLSQAFAAGRAARDEEFCEACVAFDSAHYPRGLNANFLLGEESDVVAEHMKKFEVPETRDIARALPDVMVMLKEQVGLTETSVVADIGAGTGLFLEPLARVARSVLAQEISPHFQAKLRKRTEELKLENVSIVAGNERDPCLPSGSVDVALVCDVYHHIEYPVTVCGHLLRSLRPGGRLVVIDFIRDEEVHKSHPAGWITSHVRAGQEVFRAEIESAGFRHIAEPMIPTLAENYCMIFERPE